MFSKFIPFAHAQSIYEVPVDFYKKQGVSVLLIDLDNTLDSYRLLTPTDRAVKLINSLKETGLKVIIVSNNRGKRVTSYANAIGCQFINSARKPFSGKIRKRKYDGKWIGAETDWCYSQAVQ